MMQTVTHTGKALILRRSPVLDYFSLTKPELTLLSTMTALAGFVLASEKTLDWILLAQTMMGTWMVGGGAGALNQYMERQFDALMKRTENRPLPSARLTANEALCFGLMLSIMGIVGLSVFVNPWTGLIAFLTVTTYLLLYTPLKRITNYSTFIGCFPGALPPLIGWTATGRAIDGEAFILFTLLFFWQVPHFLSLAWMYRKDYGRAGYRTMTVEDSDGEKTGKHALVHTCLLVLVSLVPAISGSGWLYGLAAAAAGFVFLCLAASFARQRSNTNARHLFTASLLYLPVLLSVWTLTRRMVR